MNETFFKYLFRTAAAYNIVVGIGVVLFPQLFFTLFGLPEINYSYVMSGLGMFVGIYGLGFYIVSLDPRKNHYFALLGLLGKSFGVIGWLYYTLNGTIPVAALWTNLFNDLIWIPFFIAYLRWHKKFSS
ncbi:MAG: alkyl hydroperoxide reductase [Bacteroidota bacterium]